MRSTSSHTVVDESNDRGRATLMWICCSNVATVQMESERVRKALRRISMDDLKTPGTVVDGLRRCSVQVCHACSSSILFGEDMFLRVKTVN